ncbi:hypothetical protein FB45DRAFT_825430 [Roridomyces roridus]|uniref:Uncharacterized protein n=1 Tax=Roridomyces roridus TaxID=1738132 RepID=A0AAD7C7B6_9AGAR|nr:hypothetical protein FB45DRAFT_825430 [Roridomyces roridus]
MDLPDLPATLAQIVTAGLDDERQPLDPLYSDTENCATLLDRQPELRASLLLARETKEYEGILNHASLRRNAARDKLNTYLKEEIRPFFEKFLRDDKSVKHWIPDPTPNSDPNLIAHIESLSIPATDSGPSLLINQLGRFGKTPELRDRVDRIFQKQAYTFLVNVSGSGKTRLGLEGLCRHWGLYFTMQRDGNDLGAADIGRTLYEKLGYRPDFHAQLPPSMSDSFSNTLELNRRVVDERFALVLLARLLVFQMFSEILKRGGGLEEEHKRRWLLFQLIPSLPESPHPDLFSDLKRFAYDLDPQQVLDWIAITFAKLRKIHGPEFHIFYVLDESQLVSRLHTEAFQHEGEGYPLLREIIQSWSAKSGSQEASFVVLGTDIPKEAFRSAPFAGSIRWLSDTGGFDDEPTQSRYISEFLPPEYTASRWGQELLQRMWAWCRGRHRTTDSFINCWLWEASSAPHQLLDAYISTSTDHVMSDHQNDEPDRDGSNDYNLLYDLSTDMITAGEHASLIMSTIQRALFHYLATGQHPAPFSADLTPLVRSGMGRFVDDQMSRVALDEPLFLLRATTWFFGTPTANSKFALFRARTAIDPSDDCFTLLNRRREHATSESLTAFIAFYLNRVFADGATLSEVFSFPHKPVPRWANQRAQLFSAGGAPWDQFAAASPVNVAGIETWLDGVGQPPLCLTNTVEPYLIVNLKMDDGRLIRVILHATVTDAILQKEELKLVMKHLQPPGLLRGRDTDTGSDRVVSKLLDTTQPDGPFAIIRVIASFPGKTFLKTAAPKPTSTSLFANLNTGMFERITREIRVSEVVDTLVTAITKRQRVPDSATSEPAAQASGSRSQPERRTSQKRKRDTTADSTPSPAPKRATVKSKSKAPSVSQPEPEQRSLRKRKRDDDSPASPPPPKRAAGQSRAPRASPSKSGKGKQKAS